MISLLTSKISRLLALTSKISGSLAALAICLMLSACIGSVIGAVVDTTIAVAKVPFKIGGAVIDVITPDDFTDDREPPHFNSEPDSVDAAVHMEATVP